MSEISRYYAGCGVLQTPITIILMEDKMGRKPSVEFKGADYHVIKRGNNRDYIFRTVRTKKTS
jgi:hypothetical protein